MAVHCLTVSEGAISSHFGWEQLGVGCYSQGSRQILCVHPGILTCVWENQINDGKSHRRLRSHSEKTSFQGKKKLRYAHLIKSRKLYQGERIFPVALSLLSSIWVTGWSCTKNQIKVENCFFLYHRCEVLRIWGKNGRDVSRPGIGSLHCSGWPAVAVVACVVMDRVPTPTLKHQLSWF